MSCDKANNCKKYKMNIGNPNDWENPCNNCPYNISDYEIGYNKAIDDFMELASNHNYGDSEAKEYVMDIVKNLAEQLRNQWGEYGK